MISISPQLYDIIFFKQGIIYMKNVFIFLAIFVVSDGVAKKPLGSKGTINVRQAVDLLDKNDKE